MRLLLTALLIAAPAAAEQAEPTERPGLKRAGEIVKEPLEDARVVERKIPPELAAIVEAPYATPPRGCAALGRAVGELDRVLGADVDAPSSGGELNGAARAALTAAEIGVDTLIPGRGLIRRITGADKVERRYQNAIQAGVIRRAYLKGLGSARGCAPPAAPQS